VSEEQLRNQEDLTTPITQPDREASRSSNLIQLPSPPTPRSAPPLPALFIGREDDVQELKRRLGSTSDEVPASLQRLIVMRGWPGVGKTSLATVLAHDTDVKAKFPGGVFWASLGQNPSLFGELAAWGRSLGIDRLDTRTVEEASTQLANVLRDKRALLIVDDLWRTEHAIPFQVGGRHCAMLITTRLPEIAHEIAPGATYVLGVLSEAKALELLQTIIPAVVSGNPEASRELVQELEGLPLAIQVAGRLLNVELSYGFAITDLLQEIRKGARLIEAQAPVDQSDVTNETTPTVAALLKKSTDLLDAHTLDCFAYLGAFAPKPATFDVDAMKAIWQVDDPNPTIRTIVDRGLLEPIGAGRFWMHSILVEHAKSFLT
jgi:hypothetical protein